MIPAYYLLLCFVAQAFLTWLVCRLMADEHQATVRALTARNAQDLKLLESPAPAPRRDTRFRPRLPEVEGDFSDAPIRPMGL